MKLVPEGFSSQACFFLRAVPPPLREGGGGSGRRTAIFWGLFLGKKLTPIFWVHRNPVSSSHDRPAF